MPSCFIECLYYFVFTPEKNKCSCSCTVLPAIGNIILKFYLNYSTGFYYSTIWLLYNSLMKNNVGHIFICMLSFCVSSLLRHLLRFLLFFFFGTNKWLSFLSYFWAFKSFLFETGYLELSRVGKIDFMRWEKSVVKSILLESKTLLSRMFCLYHNNTFLLFQPGPWGLREQEFFLCFLPSYACRVTGSKTHESKSNESVGGNSHKVWGIVSPQGFLSHILVHTKSPSTCENYYISICVSLWLQ